MLSDCKILFSAKFNGLLLKKAALKLTCISLTARVYSRYYICCSFLYLKC